VLTGRLTAAVEAIRQSPLCGCAKLG